MPSGYYYFGGYDMNAKEITVLMVEPEQHPKVTTLKDDLDSLQKAVSIGADYQGLIEIVSLAYYLTLPNYIYPIYSPLGMIQSLYRLPVGSFYILCVNKKRGILAVNTNDKNKGQNSQKARNFV